MRCAATAVLLTTLCAGCTKNADPTTVEYWAEQANSKSSRVEALKELGKLGKQEAAPVLLKWLDQPGPWQGSAAYSLAQLGDPNMAAPLIAHLDTSAKPATEAEYANRDIVRGLALLRTQEAVAPLIKLLGNPEPKTREVVINTLGQLQASAAVQPLLALAGDAATPPALAQDALRALGNIGAPQATDVLVTSLYNDVLYEEARYALVQLGPPAVAPLVKTLNRANPAVESLRSGDGKPLPDGSIEARAASVLGAMHADTDGAPAAVVAAFDKLYKRYVAKPKEAPPRVFAAIIELAYALGNLGGPASIKALIPLTKAPNDTLRVAAAEALTAAGPDPTAVQALLAATGSGSPDARDSIINAVTRLAGPDALPILDALPKKADKEATAGVLAEIVEESRERLVAAGECKGEAACWRSKLRAPNPVVRERAAYELGWLNVRDAAADLLRAAEDDVPEVRMAAVLSLQRFGGVDAAALQKIHDTWQSKMQYAAVNQELKCLIARSKTRKN